MAEEKLLNVRDVSIMLGISEKEVMDLAESAALPAYKIGGVYLRFKKEQVLDFQRRSQTASHRVKHAEKRSVKDKIGDFFYFNDFYILSIAIIIALLIVIFQG